MLGTKRRRLSDYRGHILMATITKGERLRPGSAVDYRSAYTDYLKKQNLLVYAGNYYSKDDPRIVLYIHGPPDKLRNAVLEGRRYNVEKAVGERKIFTDTTLSYAGVRVGGRLAKIPYDPTYSTCDLTTFMDGLSLMENYEWIITDEVDEFDSEDDEPLMEYDDPLMEYDEYF